MKKVIDNFSGQADSYKKFRPVYPLKLYEEILQHVHNRDQCWDCGTGNGQVAIVLSDFFKKVYATDISENQLKNAASRSNIIYSVQRAEKTNFKSNQFDLVTVGQAVHWFDFDAFNAEVKRVLKPGGIISIFGYGLLRVNTPIDRLIDEFYTEIVGPYWNTERKHVDSKYETVKFNFEELIVSNKYSIVVNWNLIELEGYFNTWSSVQNYKIKNQGKNPVLELIRKANEFWIPNEKKEIRFPIFMRIGSV